MVIAIDGPAGAGKSTVARGLAAELGFTYLDSGAMYRCVAFTCLDWGADPTSSGEATSTAESIEIGFEDGEVLIDGVPVTGEIRSAEVTEAASQVSVHPGVRSAMVAEQKRLIATGPYVTEGRDIGTVVAPDSPLKIFLTATPEARARRRASETGLDEAEVLAAQEERDRRDSEREHGALYAADDAITIDSSEMTAEEVIAEIAALARERGLA
jgi:cytidylate kinase